MVRGKERKAAGKVKIYEKIMVEALPVLHVNGTLHYIRGDDVRSFPNNSYLISCPSMMGVVFLRDPGNGVSLFFEPSAHSREC